MRLKRLMVNSFVEIGRFHFQNFRDTKTFKKILKNFLDRTLLGYKTQSIQDTTLVFNFPVDSEILKKRIREYVFQDDYFHSFQKA